MTTPDMRVWFDVSYAEMLSANVLEEMLGRKVAELAERVIEQSGLAEHMAATLPPPRYTGAAFWALGNFLAWATSDAAR